MKEDNNRPGQKDDSGPCPDNHELVLASILFLMTRYARQPDALVARGILDHILRLADHPQQRSPFILKTCERLLEQWRVIQANIDFAPCTLTSGRTMTGSTIH
ncbi:MAG: hypothetical protein R3318_05365 [Gammaproteobacteria bacterium]|nr:hypothetical protein [Gammaproteobacteria bacterium]